MENMFEKGCLVQLSISKWGGVKKIDKGRLSRMVANGDAEWVTATKKLVDPDALKPICKVANSARSYLDSVSLPFPLTGLLFVPKDLISRIDTRLEEYRVEFHQKVSDFLQDYDRLRETAMVYLGELFSEVDYPTDIRRRFSLTWRFVIMDVPNGQVGLLAPAVYEREKAKFIQTMEEARQMAVESLREEFASMVERITERFTAGPDGKPKIFKNATVDSFYDYFETFKERNIFKDEELAGLVERAQDILGGRSADDFRSNENLKDALQTQMTQVEEAMAEAFNRPRRKIIMD